jgi:type I restriction enzyme S subunit
MKPTAWPRKRLDELGFVGRGKSRHRPRNEPSLYGGPYPFIQTADVMAATPYITGYSQTYSELGFRQSKMWPANTLCMTIAGANTAKVAILKIKACFPDSVVGFIPNKTKADLHFVLYSLGLMKDQFLAVSRGATQDNLGLSKLLSFPLLAPEVTQQRKIAAVLSAYDELIENHKRRIVLLEKLAEEIYREWFVRFRFPGHGNVKKLQGVPSTWNVENLGSLVNFVRVKYVEQSHSSLPLVDLEKMAQRTLAITTTGRPDELSTSRILFAPNDVLFSTIRPYLYKVNMAPFHGVTNTSVMVLRPRSPGHRAFITITLFLRDTVAWADQYSTGTKMPVISWNVFKKMAIRSPDPALMRRFNELVSPMLDEISALSILILRLREAKDLLLPRLISGKFSVENLDIEFPPGMAEELNDAQAPATHA